MDRFAVRLLGQVDLDAVRAELLVVVDQTVQPDPGVAGYALLAR